MADTVREGSTALEREEKSPSPRDRFVRERRASPVQAVTRSPGRYERPAAREREPADDDFRERDRDRREPKRYGRSRSPPGDYDRRMKRRRSVSPGREPYDYTRDYRPRGAYGKARQPHDAYRDSYRVDPYRDPYRDPYYSAGYDARSYPSVGGYAPKPHLQPPEELNYQVSFRQYADYMQQAHPHIHDDKERLNEAWRKYRLDFQRKQLSIFFEEHKRRPWFQERYDPTLEDMRKSLKGKGRAGRADLFLARLQGGELDDLSFDYREVRKDSKVDTEDKKSGVTGEGETTEAKAEDPATGEAIPETQPDVKVEKVEAKEEVKEEDTAIKDAGASADPEVDAQDDADGAPDASRAGEDDADEKTNGIEGDDDTAGGWRRGVDEVLIPPVEHQLFIKSVSPDIKRAELEAHCKQVEGFDYLALSEPHPAKKYHRVGWVSFTPGMDMSPAVEKLCESKINNFILHMNPLNKATYQKLRTAPGITNTTERLERDLQQAKAIVQAMEKEQEDTRGSEAIEKKIEEIRSAAAAAPKSVPAESDAEMKVDEETKLSTANEDVLKKSLDLYLEYLRSVFNTCYYCICTCDFQEELLRRCVKHLRRSAGDDRLGKNDRRKHTRVNEHSWAKNLDDKVALLTNPNGVDPREYGGDNYEEELHKVCQPQVKHEEDTKFRCKLCSKLFKALNFVEKHIANKHPEVIADAMSRLKYFNNFVLDPSHVVPPAPTSPAFDPPQAAPNMMMAYQTAMFHGYPGYGAMPGFAPGFYPMPFAGYGPGYGGPPGPYGGRMDRGMDHGGPRRRLSDRISDRVDIAEAPPKRARRDLPPGPPPPPPSGAKIDPRSKDPSRIASYHDLDSTPSGAGDIILDY